jgi:pilus assembly protein Flp/PilA
MKRRRKGKMLSLYLYIRNWLESQKPEEGQDLVEYALLLGLIAIVCVIAITVAGQQVSNIWKTIALTLRNAVAGV